MTHAVEYLRDDVAEWNQFISTCEGAGFFHRAEWRAVIEQAFGHRPHYLMVRDHGAIEAVLPMFEIKSLIFGHSLVSTPFCVYGGPAYRTPAALEAALDESRRLAQRLGVEYLELRTPSAVAASWPTKDLYVTFGTPISSDREQNMKAIWRKQRTVIRKAHKQGLEHAFDTGIDDFYRVYSTSVRNLGTPVFSRRYFEILKETFGDDCEVLTVRKDGVPVSSVMSFYADGTVYPYYGGGTHAARQLKSNDYMYFELMCHAAADREVGYFDFGRSKRGTGAYEYKKHWQMQARPLEYQYHLVGGASLPDLSPNNPRYRRAIEIWKKLPLGITQVLGPIISRNLG